VSFAARPLPRCYIASPLGFSEGGRFYYKEIYLPALAQVVSPVDPWSVASPEEIVNARAAGREREMMLTIGRRNVAAIRTCTLLAADLDGQELDSGTVAEVGFAAGIGVRCFGLRTDLRQSGDAGTAVNLQVETFILESRGRISSSLDLLVEDLGAAAIDETACSHTARSTAAST
jgi:nucleoside 2-deoxyribosyltransferase